MARNRKAVNLEASRIAFEAKLAELCANKKAPGIPVVRADYDVPGFCKHGIPMHCPHCAKEVR